MLTSGSATFALTAQSVFTLVSAASAPSPVPAISPWTTGLYALTALGLGVALLRRERRMSAKSARAAR